MGGLSAPEVAGDSPSGSPAVDGQNCQVDGVPGENILKSIKGDRVPAVIDTPGPEAENIPEIFVPALIVQLSLLVRGWNGETFESCRNKTLPAGKPPGTRAIDAKTLSDEITIRLRDEELHTGVGIDERLESIRIEVIRVVVAGGGQVDEIKGKVLKEQLGHGVGKKGPEK